MNWVSKRKKKEKQIQYVWKDKYISFTIRHKPTVKIKTPETTDFEMSFGFA